MMREWRYVPYDLNHNPAPVFASILESVQLNTYNELLKERSEYTLQFDYTDIKYIIVDKEEEIMPLMSFLRSEKSLDGYSPRFTEEELILLNSRVITNPQIIKDF